MSAPGQGGGWYGSDDPYQRGPSGGQHEGQPGQYGQGQYGAGQPGQYGQGQPGQAQPGQHGGPPAQGSGYGQSSGYAQGSGYGQYGGQQGSPGSGYAYSPYGAPYQPGAAGGGAPEPASRPGILILALVLLILSSLLFLFLGGLLTVITVDLTTLPQVTQDQLAQAGVNVADLLPLVRGVGILVLVLALAYDALAVLAFLGRNWARIMLTVFTVLYGLLMLVVVGTNLTDLATVGLFGGILLASVGGTVLLFLPAARPFFASRAR